MLSTQTKYAIQALRWLGGIQRKSDENAFTQVVSVASATDIPAPYLSKIMKKLAEAGIVESKKGFGGGVRISKNLQVQDLTFARVCEVLNDPLVRDECILLRSLCNSQSPCPFHAEWSGTKKRFLEFLSNRSLNDAVREGSKLD